MIQNQLYTAEQTRLLDAKAIELGTPGSALMERAGKAAFELIQSRWPQVHTLHIVCGTGNNGGDGFVIARLAKHAGLHVFVHVVGDKDKISNEAKIAFDAMQATAIHTTPLMATITPSKHVLIVDALFGTGLARDASGKYLEAIDWINQEPCDVLAIDIPSGVSANTGQILGQAVKADACISFIGKNIGLYLAQARDLTGEIFFNDLVVPDEVFSITQPVAQLLEFTSLRQKLAARKQDSHKGHFGHVLVIGGNYGFAGAALMAAIATLRVGAGLCSVATRPEHIAGYISRQPEIMAHGITQIEQLDSLIDSASHIVIGPGLGQDSWAHELLMRVVLSNKPALIDADALNILATEIDTVEDKRSESNNDWIITPHPGEAARLLKTQNACIQKNRIQSVKELHKALNAVAVLKGSGTLIYHDKTLSICDKGNPHMASGGMGDVLCGIIAGLWAQGLNAGDATKLGVLVHAIAADIYAENNKGLGLLATDLIEQTRKILNSY